VRAIAALNREHLPRLRYRPNYLVMELVEGATLADRIERGPLPLRETLAIARQIGDALEAAHEKRIVHRDLKPANVKTKPDGTVKVLDLGLAKMTEAAALVAGPGDSPTAPNGRLRRRQVIGTPTSRGRHRLRRPRGILTKDPDLNPLPSRVRYVVERCLRRFRADISGALSLRPGCPGGQLVAAIIIGMRSVAFGPCPARLVTCVEGVELLPQILVDDGFLGFGHPTVSFPIHDPARDAVLQVFRIRNDLDFARFFQSGETSDGRRELHAIVSCVGLGPVEFALVILIAKNTRPSPRAGIPEASAVGDQLNGFHAKTGV
jgi:hypothetical protein